MMMHSAAAGLGLVVLLVAALGAAGAAKPLPDGTIPDCFGVNIHFTGDDPQLDMIAAGGFRLIRMDLVWERVEKVKGVYDFAETGYDALSAGCARRGIRPLYILDYGNRLYEPERSVRTEQGREAYAAFAEAAARHHSGQGFLWEIWNEPNIKNFWKPEPNADDYMAMLKAAAPRIRAADPSGMLLAPATSAIDMKWLEECFQRGMLDYVDGVTIHPYRDTDPETVIPEYAALREMVAKYAPAGRKVPILSGEWGFATVKWDGSHRSEEMQAAYLARQFLLNLYQDVPMSIWYDWRNDGTNPDDVEANLGTVAHDLKPKPAYVAARTLMTNLDGYRFEKRLPLGSDHDYALLLANGERRAVAAWTTGADHEARIPLAPAKGRLVKMLGETSSISWGADGPSLTLTQTPVYIAVED